MERRPLSPLWKGKEVPDLATAYRSIFVSNYTAKLYHQCIRTHLVLAWEQSLAHLQCGGRAGVGADVAHHIQQCHQAWAASTGCTSAILFLDIRAAFYTVLRQAFTAIPATDTAQRSWLR